MRNVIMKMWSDVVLGALFVVSGFVKAVDPIGFSYKIEEYLGMFQLSDWSVFSMSFSVMLCSAEMTMSETEKFMQANVEALTLGEPGGGTRYECYDRYKLYTSTGTLTTVRTCDICDYKQVYKPRTKSVCPR